MGRIYWAAAPAFSNGDINGGGAAYPALVLAPYHEAASAQAVGGNIHKIAIVKKEFLIIRLGCLLILYASC